MESGRGGGWKVEYEGIPWYYIGDAAPNALVGTLRFELRW